MLSLLSVPKILKKFGPVKLHYEGESERKIQDIKVDACVRRSNTNWPTIMLQRLLINHTLSLLIRGAKWFFSKERRVEQLYSRHRDKNAAETALSDGNVLFGVLHNDGNPYLCFSPPNNKKRSAVALLPLNFDDGVDICGCHMATVTIDSTSVGPSFDSYRMLDKEVRETLLFLPLTIHNKVHYYAIGDRWTERNCNGEFVRTTLSTGPFDNWKLPGTETTTDTYPR